MKPLRIVTWNIHGCVGTDGVRDADRVADALSEVDADIVGLQEVDCRQSPARGPDQLDRIAERTGMCAVPGPVRREGNGYFGNALLVREAAVSVKSVEHVDLTVAGREPRGILDVELGIGGVLLRMLVTHFGLRARERRRQVDALLEVVTAAAPAPLALVGDFNEWHPRAASLSRLHAALGRLQKVRTFPSAWPLLALDRIWFRPATAVVEVRAVRDRGARRASDHLPLLAVIDRGRLAAAVPG